MGKKDYNLIQALYKCEHQCLPVYTHTTETHTAVSSVIRLRDLITSLWSWFCVLILLIMRQENEYEDENQEGGVLPLPTSFYFFIIALVGEKKPWYKSTLLF